MPEDFSFINKLRMDNLYPTMPRKKIRGYPLFDRFKQEMNSPSILNEDRGSPIERIGQQAQQTGQMNNTTKPMDVVFDQGNISETARALGAARNIHGIDLQRNALSPYQAGQLQNKDRELGIREQNVNLGQQRVNETREMGEFKRLNPGGEFVNQPDGNILYVGPGGKVLGNFGPSGKMAEERKMGVEQQNDIQKIDRTGEVAGALEDKRQYGRSALEGQRGLNAIATENVRNQNRPIGANREVAYEYGPQGQIIGAKSKTQQVMPPPPQSIRGNAAMMYGPDGKQYPVPIENTDEAQEKYGMTFTPIKKK